MVHGLQASDLAGPCHTDAFVPRPGREIPVRSSNTACHPIHGEWNLQFLAAFQQMQQRSGLSYAPPRFFGVFARGCFVFLGEIASGSPPMKFVDCLLSEILPTSDVDGLEPALAPPPPGRYLRDPDLRQPFREANDRRPRI